MLTNDETHVDLRRVRIIEVAETFIGTPFHHAARLKGVGIDCANLLAEVYEEANITPHLELPFFVPDWMLHRTEERFLAYVLGTGAREITVPLPGDIALFKFGRCYSHGAIVTHWPRVIHAIAPLGAVVRGDATQYPLLDRGSQPRPVKFYTLVG